MAKGSLPFKKETAKCESCIVGKQKNDPFFTSKW
jgi:hypothetical protein